MATALNFQLTIFGNYSIPPSPEIIMTLMSEINETTHEVFLPNVINVQQVDIQANRIITTANLGFVTQDQKFSIAILNERIDVSYNKVSDQEMHMDTFYNLAAKAMESIMRNLGLRSNRLAENIQMLFEFSDLDKIEAIGKRLIKSAEYYNDKSLCEWSTRVNSQAKIDISGTEESINIITDISKMQPAPSGSILYHIDINTLPQKMDMRFNHETLSPFIKAIAPISAKILSDVERLITSE